MTFVIVGAGPTGVELAGTLAEVAHGKPWHAISATSIRRRRASSWSRRPTECWARSTISSRRRRRSQLERLGVEVRLGAPVSEITAAGVRVGTRLDRRADRPLGGGRGRIAPGAHPGDPARSGRPRPGRARPHGPRSPERLRDRRPGPSRARRQARARHRPGGHARGPPRRRERAANPARSAAAARSITSTKGCWPPSAAAPPSRTSARSAPRATSPGYSGCSFISSS